VDDEPRSGKRDRLARITRVVSLLRAHPDGMPIRDIARRIDVSVRTVYRDLNAIEGQIGIGVWSEEGRWGLATDEFLPPLKLTQDEAMAVVLSARLMVRYADKYDPDLASAFEKLGEVLPRALSEHVARTARCPVATPEG
jgi:Predicted transcriptional regulator